MKPKPAPRKDELKQPWGKNDIAFVFNEVCDIYATKDFSFYAGTNEGDGFHCSIQLSYAIFDNRGRLRTDDPWVKMYSPSTPREEITTEAATAAN